MFVLNVSMVCLVESMIFFVLIFVLFIIRGRILIRILVLFLLIVFLYGIELFDVLRLYCSILLVVVLLLKSEMLINKINEIIFLMCWVGFVKVFI